MKRVILFIAIFCLAILVNGQAVRKYIVAADGTGNYKTVQQAFDAVPLNNQVPIEIFIRKGIYKEKLHLDSSKNFVTLTGEDKNTTILTFDDHTGTVTATGEIINTMTSQSFYIKANDFRAENLTFENNAGMMVGQAVAIRIDGDRVVFTNCRILGFSGIPCSQAEVIADSITAIAILKGQPILFLAHLPLYLNTAISTVKRTHMLRLLQHRQNIHSAMYLKSAY